MSCGYYLKPAEHACVTCKRVYPARMIGVSAMGWCFSLCTYPDEGIRDLDDWRRLFDAPGARIEDEYGNAKTVAEMLATITERSCSRPPSAEWLAKSGGVLGPNNLLRPPIRGDGLGCVAHGAGTWDLFRGELG